MSTSDDLLAWVKVLSPTLVDLVTKAITGPDEGTEQAALDAAMQLQKDIARERARRKFGGQ